MLAQPLLICKKKENILSKPLMEMDCIPSGIELFPAADEEQWDFIKKVIDECDYYLLLIGGRYSSLSPEGISYTPCTLVENVPKLI